MKKTMKKIVGFTLGAAFALTLGAGVCGVVNSYDEPTVTASAATVTKDLSGSIYNLNQYYNGDWGTHGDFKEAGLYRFWISADKSLVWNEGGSSLNEAGRDEMLKYIKVNGKTIADWRSAYAAGETNKITWTGMPDNGAESPFTMHTNIAADVNSNGHIYAPISVSVAQHGELGGAIDMYIPDSFISEVTSIEFLKGFEWNYGGEVFGFSENVTFARNSLKLTYKVVGERNFDIVETSVTSIDGSYGRIEPSNGKLDQFLSFYLEEGKHDYQQGNTVAVADKDLLRSINFFDYILIDGVPMGSLWIDAAGKYENPSEQFFNVWGRTGSFGLRWPRQLMNAGTTDSVQEIKILAGCQFPSKTNANTLYQVKEDITFIRQESGAFADPNSLIGAKDVAINWATKDGEGKELFKIDIDCADWVYDLGANGDAYDLNYFDPSRVEIRDNILINGVSVYDINTKVDDSAYEYKTDPSKSNSTQQASPKDKQNYDVFKNPVVLYVQNNVLSLLIHEDYMNTLCKTFGDTVTITVKKEICNSAKISGKVLTEDVTAVAYGIGYDLVLMDGTTTVDTMSVLGGFAISGLPTLTADYKTFAGWVDANGNPAPAVMPDEAMTLYAKWNSVPYTLTIKYMDGQTKNFTFGVAVDEEMGIALTTADLAGILSANLPEGTDDIGYGYAEKVPSYFNLQDYVFTVTTVQVKFTITFVGENGEDIGIAPMEFTAKTIDDLQLPAVPEKEGYKGAWNKTVDRIRFEDTVLTAVYTEISKEPATPDTPNTPNSSVDSGASDDTEDKGSIGCMGTIGGLASGIVALGVAAVGLLKKKED